MCGCGCLSFESFVWRALAGRWNGTRPPSTRVLRVRNTSLYALSALRQSSAAAPLTSAASPCFQLQRARYFWFRFAWHECCGCKGCLPALIVSGCCYYYLGSSIFLYLHDRSFLRSFSMWNGMTYRVTHSNALVHHSEERGAKKKRNDRNVRCSHQQAIRMG